MMNNNIKSESIKAVPDTVLILTFGNIELEPDSSGFVSFSILPHFGLSDGTEIRNQAGIYFDNNEVVLTNITKNTLYDVPEPDALYTYNHNCSSSGLVYDFEYTGETPDGATYYWEFTDGTPATSTSQNPSNIIFSSTGYKDVTLTVTRHGCTESVSDTIQVSSVWLAGDSLIICHNYEDGVTMHIPADSLASHLSHGDCVGPCNSLSARLGNQIDESGLFDCAIIPNPANDLCNVQISGNKIDNEIMSIDLLNYTGNLVQSLYTGPVVNAESLLLDLKINTSNITQGLYFVKVRYGANFRMQKMIIKH